MQILIRLGDQYVSPAHIVEVLIHPVARVVCVLLTNEREIRITVGNRESREDALNRVVLHIRTNSHA